jgi:FMN phosphatase YigB (HAD superfamily)
MGHESHAQTQKKVIIWDLGNVLFKTSRFQMAYNIGILDFIVYPFSTGNNPVYIKEKAFDMLGMLSTDHLGPFKIARATDQGKELPPAFCTWLAGLQSGHDIISQSKQLGEILRHQGYFYNDREYKLVQNTIQSIFDPQIFANSTHPIEKGIRLLKKCSRAGYRMMVLSNWDPQSFDILYNSKKGQRVLKYFEPHDIVISGHTSIIKPDPRAFTDLLTRYNLKPEECIFIDDEKHNTDSATSCGIDSIHMNTSYKRLEKKLKLKGIRL